MTRVMTVIGGAIFNKGSEFEDPVTLNTTIELLNTHGINQIDSAMLYDGSEAFIGETRLSARGFIIDTKTPGGWQPGSSTREGVVQNLKQSLKKLHVEKAHVFYIHTPDKEVALEETLAGINDAYKEGLFDRFGLSNFQPSDVEIVYRLAEKMGYVIPTVYQGCYSPVTRKAEEVLIPLLRKLGMSFYAYSPLSGGFLMKTKEQVLVGTGRFDRSHEYGRMYEMMFFKPAYLETLAEWASIAEKESITRAELAYRWVASSSILKPQYGDALIIGSRTLDQLKQTVEGLEKGPLSKSAQERIEAIWAKVKHEALLDNFEAAQQALLGIRT